MEPEEDEEEKDEDEEEEEEDLGEWIEVFSVLKGTLRCSTLITCSSCNEKFKASVQS